MASFGMPPLDGSIYPDAQGKDGALQSCPTLATVDSLGQGNQGNTDGSSAFESTSVNVTNGSNVVGVESGNAGTNVNVHLPPSMESFANQSMNQQTMMNQAMNAGMSPRTAGRFVQQNINVRSGADGATAVNVDSDNQAVAVNTAGGETSVNVDGGDGNVVGVQSGYGGTNVNVGSAQNRSGFANQSINQQTAMNQAMNAGMSPRSAARFAAQYVNVRSGADGTTAVNVDNDNQAVAVNTAGGETSVNVDSGDGNLVGVQSGYGGTNVNVGSSQNRGGIVNQSMNQQTVVNQAMNAGMSPRSAGRFAAQYVNVQSGADGTTAVNVDNENQAVAVNTAGGETSVNVDGGNGNLVGVRSGCDGTNVNVGLPQNRGGFANQSMNQQTMMNQAMNAGMSPRTAGRFVHQNVNVRSGADGTTAVNVDNDNQAVAVNTAGGETSVNVDGGDGNLVGVRSGYDGTNVNVGSPQNRGGFANQSINQQTAMNQAINAGMSPRSAGRFAAQYVNVRSGADGTTAVNVDNDNQAVAVNTAGGETSVDVDGGNGNLVGVRSGCDGTNVNVGLPQNKGGFANQSVNQQTMMNQAMDAGMSPRTAGRFVHQNVNVRSGADGTTAVNVDNDNQAVAVNTAGGETSVNVDSGDGNLVGVRSGYDGTNVNVGSPQNRGGFANQSINQQTAMNQAMNAGMSPRSAGRFAAQYVNVRSGADGTTAVNVDNDNQAVAVNTAGGETSVNVDGGDGNLVGVRSGYDGTNVNVGSPQNRGGFANQSVNQQTMMNQAMDAGMSPRTAGRFVHQNVNVQSGADGSTAVNVDSDNQAVAVNTAGGETSVNVDGGNGNLVGVRSGYGGTNVNVGSPRNRGAFSSPTRYRQSLVNQAVNAGMSPRSAGRFAAQYVNVRSGADGATAVNVDNDNQAVAVNTAGGETSVNVDGGNGNLVGVRSGCDGTNVNVGSPQNRGGFANQSMNQQAVVNQAMNAGMSPRTAGRFAAQNVNVRSGVDGTTAVNVDNDNQAVAVNTGSGETLVNVDGGDGNVVGVQSGSTGTNVNVRSPSNM